MPRFKVHDVLQPYVRPCLTRRFFVVNSLTENFIFPFLLNYQWYIMFTLLLKNCICTVLNFFLGGLKTMVLQFFKWRGVSKVYCGRCENGERDQKI